ncbi:MAG: polysaccharide deacetylase family protein [Limnochordia bacterium]|jgi:peptidoglycan/xylan/chitin deacetylase (PgdA/CDA1 family)
MPTDEELRPAQRQLLVLLGFDMETDVGSWTPFYTGLTEGTPRILELLQKKNATGTFFFVGDAARAHPEVVRSVLQAGHEVGCHSLYHETVGDPLFPIPGVYPLLPEEVPLRIRRATELVEDACGSKVLSFRSPRLWGSSAVLRALAELGYIADASYPLYYYRERLAPYYPAADDWTREGDLPVLEVPNFADISQPKKDVYGRDADQWPVFRTQGAHALMQSVKRFIAYADARLPAGVPLVLCFYMHPWEFAPMPQGPIHYGEGSVIPDPFIVEGCGETAVTQLGVLLDALSEIGCGYVTAAELARVWPELAPS